MAARTVGCCLATLIVPFLVVAFVALYGFPSDTDKSFADVVVVA